jgi:hypothetical protein
MGLRPEVMLDLELSAVKLSVLTDEGIPTCAPAYPILNQDLAKERQVALQRLACSRRRILVPDVINEDFGRDGLIGGGQQADEKCPTTGPTDGHLATVGPHDQRAEYLEFEHFPILRQ